MLQNFRDYFPKWVLIAFLGLLACLVAFLGLYNPMHPDIAPLYRTAIRVNGHKISHMQLRQACDDFKKVYHMQSGGVHMTLQLQQQLEVAAFRHAVLVEVCKQRARRYGYRVHLAAIREAIQSIPAFQVNQQFSRDKFLETILELGYNRASFSKFLETKLLLRQMPLALMESAFILPKELTRVVKLMNQQRDFEYAEFETKDFLEPNSCIPQKAIQDYYDHNLAALRVPEQVSVEYIMLSLAESSAEANDSVKKQAKHYSDRLVRLRQLLGTYPMSLVEIAKELGLTIKSTPLFTRAGGDSEITSHAAVVAAAFSKAVLEGYNSSLIRLTEDRAVLIRLKQHQPLHVPALESIKDTIQHKLRVEKAKQAAQRSGEDIIATMPKASDQAVSLPFGYRWKKVVGAKRDARAVSSEILRHAFTIQRDAKAIPLVGVTLSNGNYVLIRLLHIKQGQLNYMDDQQVERFQTLGATMMGECDDILYQEASMQQANIKYSSNL